MSEKPEREYEAGGDASARATGDTVLVSHDVEPPEHFARRLGGDPDSEGVPVTSDRKEFHAALMAGLKMRYDAYAGLAQELRARDAVLRLAVLEEAARACSSEADARAVRDLKRRPGPATS